MQMALWDDADVDTDRTAHPTGALTPAAMAATTMQSPAGCMQDGITAPGAAVNNCGEGDNNTAGIATHCTGDFLTGRVKHLVRCFQKQWAV